MTENATVGRRPVNQTRRINLLRAVFLLVLLPLILFTRSVWPDEHPVFETLEVLGVFLVIGAVLGRFWAILYSGGAKNRRVVQDGLYSICRAPALPVLDAGQRRVRADAGLGLPDDRAGRDDRLRPGDHRAAEEHSSATSSAPPTTNIRQRCRC